MVIKNKFKKIGMILILVMFSMFILACSTEKVTELTPVKVQLKWVHQAQFAGNYVAQEKGFYQEEGIEIIELKPFDYVNWPIDRIENKEVDFAITGGDELILAKASGKADHVKAIAVIYKINPVCLYSLAETKITQPEDLLGKTIGIERAADGSEINVGILYKAMMSKLNLNKEKVNEITIGYGATELLAGETDVSTGYVINEPHQAIEAGQEVNIILPAEYGVNMYADIIIVHEDMIKENPELVKGFIDATLNGWQYAIENEKEAVEIVLKYATERSQSHEAYMLKESVPLIHTGEPLGLMKEEEWKNINSILIENNLLEQEVSLEEIYTNEFIR
jgi:NitT/TauT family transport system substrate-binding protein